MADKKCFSKLAIKTSLAIQSLYDHIRVIITTTLPIVVIYDHKAFANLVTNVESDEFSHTTMEPP